MSNLAIFGHFLQNLNILVHYAGFIFTIFLKLMYNVAYGFVDIMYKFQLD